MENFPQSVSINMQPYGRNWAGSPATAFGPTVTSFVQPGPVPNTQDFVLWSFFNSMFCNPFCLGFIALVFSVKARDCKVLGDLEGARRHGARAKVLNIICSVLLVLIVVAIIVVIIIVISTTTT
ncbi:PREDICTED: interferon-induced transmembrane protein 3 [Pygoscelis adeliae]|uniref:interferon-induced transmembrane protein 3 n=1 Tax=Pygoscelis adeliae TaxID=9238 RepID=UPI0004F5006A|nr:PREDICTED: interferon-induced transmembrane protein 3 [Pygoscelis adeliae]